MKFHHKVSQDYLISEISEKLDSIFFRDSDFKFLSKQKRFILQVLMSRLSTLGTKKAVLFGFHVLYNALKYRLQTSTVHVHSTHTSKSPSVLIRELLFLLFQIPCYCRHNRAARRGAGQSKKIDIPQCFFFLQNYR